MGWAAVAVAKAKTLRKTVNRNTSLPTRRCLPANTDLIIGSPSVFGLHIDNCPPNASGQKRVSAAQMIRVVRVLAGGKRLGVRPRQAVQVTFVPGAMKCRSDKDSMSLLVVCVAGSAQIGWYITKDRQAGQTPGVMFSDSRSDAVQPVGVTYTAVTANDCALIDERFIPVCGCRLSLDQYEFFTRHETAVYGVEVKVENDERTRPPLNVPPPENPLCPARCTAGAWMAYRVQRFLIRSRPHRRRTINRL